MWQFLWKPCRPARLALMSICERSILSIPCSKSVIVSAALAYWGFVGRGELLGVDLGTTYSSVAVLHRSTGVRIVEASIADALAVLPLNERRSNEVAW